MRKTFYICSFLIISYFTSVSQNSIYNYKYIIVPNQFEFLNSKDQYQINSLTKFLFNKYGYKAFMQDEDFPEDLQNNRCLALTSDVVKENGLFKTKLRIDLKDCNGNIVQSSQIGETREKEFAKAYNLSLRDAFLTFQNMNYVYQPKEDMVSKTAPLNTSLTNHEKDEIARLKDEIKTLKEEKVEMVESQEETSKKPEELIETLNNAKEFTSEVLYAQPIDNGFQIVDTTPKKVMILQNSGVKDVFKVEGKKAIVFKKGDVWMYSESGDILKGEIINIKF